MRASEGSGGLQPRSKSERFLYSLDPSLCNILILRGRAGAAADGTHHHAILHDRNSAGYRHKSPRVAVVDAESGAAGPHVLPVDAGGRPVAGCGEGLVDSDVDGGELGAVHACEGQEVACLVDNGDVHGDADFLGTLFGGRERGARALEREDGNRLGRHGGAAEGKKKKSAQASGNVHRAIRACR